MEFFITQENANGTVFYNELSKDEWKALNDLLTDIRAKRKYEELLQKCKMSISFAISDSIGTIGLADTKTIVRELAR